MRQIALAALVLAALGLSSCATRPTAYRNSEVITVTGKAQNEQLRLLDSKLSAAKALEEKNAKPLNPAWAQKQLFAKGNGLPPLSSSSVETRGLMAKLQAVGEARRALGRQIEQMAIADGERVIDYSQNSEEIRRRIEEIIFQATVAEEQELPDGAFEVTMQLRVDSLADFLPPRKTSPGRLGASEAVAVDAASRMQIDALKKQAGKDAEKIARGKLLEIVKGAQMTRGFRVGQAMSLDAALDRKIRSRIAAAQPSDIRFGKDGECEVDIPFDLAVAKRLVEEIGWDVP